MTIGWYPGHMSKARRLLEGQLAKVDIIVEVCDARLPASSRNPQLDSLVAHKNHILLLNKADLASPGATAQWLAWFRKDGLTAVDVVSKGRSNKVMKLIEAAAKDQMARFSQRGYKKTVRAMIVGVPNVGKSTIINRLAGKNMLKVEDRPGVTRANHWVKISPFLELMDTPGLLWPKLEDQQAAQRLAYIAAIRDEVLDTYKLCVSLVNDLMDIAPDQLCARYQIDDRSLRGDQLIEAVSKARGFLLKGGLYDTERAVSVILDEFRDGIIGRITLEYPPAADATYDEKPPHGY